MTELAPLVGVCAGCQAVLADDAVCLLDVPVHKTGTAFTKPLDPIVGQAIQAWQALRPEQPQRLDRKTNEQVDPRCSIRAHPFANNSATTALRLTSCPTFRVLIRPHPVRSSGRVETTQTGLRRDRLGRLAKSSSARARSTSCGCSW